MVQFYFNSCYPNTYFNGIQEVFCDFVKSYKILYDKYKSCIVDGLITSALPSQIIIGDAVLMDLIRAISDKDTIRFASSLFSKYPIDKFISKDIWESEDCYFDYSFNGVDAYDLFYAYKMEWFLCSLPLDGMYRRNYLTIIPSDETYEEIQIINFFADNIEFISNEIENNPDYHISNKESLKSKIFASHNCVFSNVFEEQYDNSPADVQKHINNKFKLALDRNMLFPSVQVDKDLIKSCRGDGLDGLFELRSRAGDGIRIYFEVHNDTLVIGMLSTKAQSKGKEQTSDMLRAKNIIQNTLQ